MNRAGEGGGVPKRSARFFCIDEAWYFRTREGAPMGPFNDIDEAEDGLHNFLEFLALAEPETRSRLHESLTRH